MKINPLTEALFAGDLNGMIKSVLSIAEYSPKVSEDAIVLAFFSSNPDAAEDLAVFLEKSSIESILDAEVSSAPDEDGDYLIFIEIEKDEPVKTITQILHIVNHVCEIKKWEFQAYKLPRTYALTDDNLIGYFRKMKELGIS